MLAIVPIIILAGGFTAGAFDNGSIQDISSNTTETATIVLSAAEIQDNNDRDLYFN